VRRATAGAAVAHASRSDGPDEPVTMSTRVLLTLAAVLVPAAAARAHDLQAKVTVAADHVRVEAFYEMLSDKSPAEQATVTLLDAARAVVHAGKANARGIWTCPRPA